MKHPAIIGKNFDTTLRYINDPAKSEWYIPEASRAMTLQQLKQYQQQLIDQNNHWLEAMNGANVKSVQNISRIMENQNSKLAKYEAMILEIESANQAEINPVTGQPVKQDPELPPATKKPNWLLYGGIAVAAIFLLRK